MDTLSHGLWAGAAVMALARRKPVTRAQLAGAVVMGILPDIAQAIPVLGWALTRDDSIAAFMSFAAATPGREAVMPPGIEAVSHHLHCMLHSIVIAALATLAAWRLRPVLLVPFVGWWLHILLDVPTHSESYYAVPLLYPFTYWGVDGIAWTTPWVLAVNYGGLALAYGLLARRREWSLP